MSKEENKLLVMTDLEPDDVMAFYVLYKRGYAIGSVFIGERDIVLLTKLLNDLLMALSKDGIVSEMPKVLTTLDELKCEIKEVSTILSLKPCKELIQLTEDELHDKTIYFYGGFNFRTLKDGPTVVKMLNCCKDVYIYESFHATGENNGLNDTLYPKLYESIAKYKNFNMFLRGVISDWNSHIVNKQKKNVEYYLNKGDTLTDVDKEGLRRAQKIIDTVSPTIEVQMLLADCGLAAVMDNMETKQYYVSLNNFGYLVLHDKQEDISTTKQCKIYKDLNKDSVVECMYF